MMKNIKTYVFNAYGALLDTYLPFEKYRDELGENALIIYKLWRSKRLQYSSQLSLMNQYTSYDRIQKYALDFACEVYGVSDEGIKKKILKAHSELTCYPDVKEVLTSLKESGLQTAVLSNGTPQKLSSTLRHAGIDHLLDGVYSTAQVHAYKPSPAVYDFVGEQLGLAHNRICFVSSNSWDIAGAASYGFTSVWVNRYGRTPEHLPYKADHEIKSLGELLSLE
ncbi:MAG: haloacid dehalogenase type II [Gammaproteobacteria bacterium]|nr:haloacid dehalogenase type II [Gammaproteobacteria bacterium]